MTFQEAYLKTNSWQRKVILVSVFHRSRLMKDSKWTVRNTAKYFKISMGLCSENLQLSCKLDDIETCKSRNEALKVIKNHVQAKQQPNT